jgi:hypothetical protein
MGDSKPIVPTSKYDDCKIGWHAFEIRAQDSLLAGTSTSHHAREGHVAEPAAEVRRRG